MAAQELAGGTPHFEVQGAVARITLARPAHRNRLHNEDLAALMAIFERIDGDTSIRAVVLGAQVLPQRPVFSAGFNATEFDDAPGAVSFEQVVDALERLRPVTICALNGSVYGGATDLALTCDFRIGVETMELRMPAARLGLHYYASGLRRYLTRLGIGPAKKLFMTAQAVGAEELQRIGYLDLCVPADRLDAKVLELVQNLLANAPLAVRGMKASLNEIARGDFALDRLREREALCAASDDLREGLAAFAAKRAPRFSGR